MRYAIAKPDHFDLKPIAALIAGGGAVTAEGLLERLQRARLLAVCFDGKQVVGVAAIKAPAADYTDDVLSKAGVALPFVEPAELGWLCVAGGYRNKGLASRLTAMLLMVEDAPLFATSANPYARRILNRNAFRSAGKSWEGVSGEIHFYTR